MARIFSVAMMLVVLSLGVSSEARGYGGDTHYYLRFATALEVCFTWDEAHLIASADYMLDKNRATTAEKHPFKKHNKINWHAFGGNEERFNELWERVLNEKDPQLQLIKLGQFLHFISDWESHYGYGVRMGHGIPTVTGRDPDSLGANRMNNLRMIDQTIDHMVEVCMAWGRNVWSGSNPDQFRANLYKDLASESVLDDMFLYNSRKWKSWGVRGKKGKEILAHNHLLIEQLIERRRTKTPKRNVPEDFQPGDPEKGIPPPLGIRYDSEGRPLQIYGVEVELMPEFQGPDTFGDDLPDIFGDDLSVSEVEILEESLEPEFLDEMEEKLQKGEDLDLYANLEMSVLDVDLAQGGWKVEVAVENLGLGASGKGTLDIFVIHMASEELLGETSRPISTLKGGERIKMSLLVPSDDEPGKEILVGASLKMPSELSADNNSAWFIPWKDRISSSEKKKKFGKSTSQVTLLHQPRLWRDDTGNGAWIVISAVVAGGRSSRRITGLQVSLVNEAGPIRLPLNDDEHEPIWMSVPDLKRRVVPAETLVWFRLNDDLCNALTEGGPPTTLDVTITGADIEAFTGSYALDPEFAAALVSSCPAAGSARPASPAD